jgi:hypothetical protein
MDDLVKLELNLEKLSSSFCNSLYAIQMHAPLLRFENEEDMEASKQNLDRIKVEKIENYEENKKNYQQLISNKSQEMNSLFEEIHNNLNSLKDKEEYKKTDEELKKNLRNLKDWNELKIKNINDKIKHVDDIIYNIKKESTSMDYFD